MRICNSIQIEQDLEKTTIVVGNFVGPEESTNEEKGSQKEWEEVKNNERKRETTEKEK